MPKNSTKNSPEGINIKLGAGLFEVFSTGHLLALFNEKNEPITDLVHCKDYFQDQIYATEYGVKGKQYGFTYKPIATKEYRMAITSDIEKKPITDDKAVLDTLHYHEDIIGLKRSTIEKIGVYKNKTDILLFKSDQGWYKYAILTSLLSLLIRIAMFNTNKARILNLLDIKKDKELMTRIGRDNSSIINSESFKENYNAVLNQEFNKFKNFGDFNSVQQLHNHSGIKNNSIKRK